MDKTVRIAAAWYEWDGKEFAPNGTGTLDARVTPKLYMVTLPSGYVWRCKRFDRVGRPNTTWSYYYGTSIRKCIRLKLEAAQ